MRAAALSAGRSRRKHRSAPLRVVAIGGGTGLPAILSGLARAGRTMPGLPPLELTAVVAVSDDGGSSGRLHREQGILPPGDVRNCLVALAGRRRMARLFQYRFGRGEGLEGHAMGNLLLAAMAQLEGDFLAAVERAGELLGCRGRVLPCTLEPVQLVGRLAGGGAVVGESALGHAPRRIERVELRTSPGITWTGSKPRDRKGGARQIGRFSREARLHTSSLPSAGAMYGQTLRPGRARPAPGVREAIRAADVVVLGPGSLYSSVIAPLLVEGVAAALQGTGALRIFVQNLMNQPGETDGLDAAGHVRAVLEHAGPVIDLVLVHSSHAGLRTDEARGRCPVPLDRRALRALGMATVEAELVGAGRSTRHDPAKAAAAILGLSLEAVEA